MPLLKSWVESANRPDHPFPLNNLPCGVFSAGDHDPRCGVAIGDMILDMRGLEESGLVARIGGDDQPLFEMPYWNDFMEAGPERWRALRELLTALLGEGAKAADRAIVEPQLVAASAAELDMPFAIAEFTDFYSGIHHARNVGTMLRGAENALPPSWLHMPIGYNGRASSVVVSETSVRRPWGQLKSQDRELPAFLPSRRFDFELELGAVVGKATDGPVAVEDADGAIFGYVLLNDWSARDIQAWEYQPLGPFQSKATATTISPWIVTSAALEPFRVAAPEREVALLDHLADQGPMHLDIELEVWLAPDGKTASVLSRTNGKELYFSAAQQLAHHATSGCPMNVGDLLGSGTVSGPERDQRGSLLELSWGGREPVVLETGESRSFLEDGDTVTLTGRAIGDGYQVGFGDCAGTVSPALTNPFEK